jgi:hypothetical protein
MVELPLHSAETPAMIKTLAVAFAGYLMTLVTTAHGIASEAKEKARKSVR